VISLVFNAVQIKGGVADLDGQLVPGDQILVVNGMNVRNTSQPETAALLKVEPCHLLLCFQHKLPFPFLVNNSFVKLALQLIVIYFCLTRWRPLG
jgi:hypothetical protein